MRSRFTRLSIALVAGSSLGTPTNGWGGERSLEALRDVLTATEWVQVHRSSDKGLAWLASQEDSDGSFPTLRNGQPGVSGLCVLAFLAHGHAPGEGPYGDRITRAIDFIVSQQKPSGLIAALAPQQPALGREVPELVGVTTAYNHAISSLALGEAYGMLPPETAPRVAAAIRRSLKVSLEMQSWATRPSDRGGWRYLHRHNEQEADLSITGWELMFLRSAKNAGFDVPQAPIDSAVSFVQRCFSNHFGTFQYKISTGDTRTRGMAGAGVLALAHAGFHNSREAQAAGEWILLHDFSAYNTSVHLSSRDEDRYHYGVFNCSQAMYQLGGKYWAGFFPGTATALVDGQAPDGSWPPETHARETPYGRTYTSALSLLALAAPNQLLPIFQR